MNIGKKLKTISALCGAALLTVSLAACGQQDAAGFIGLDAAKAIALENAGVAESAATFSATELDRQSGSGVYTIDFTANGQSYAYDIDALTGSILSGAPETAGASAGTAITAQQAQEIALSHAGLSSSQVSFVRAHLDWDDGRQVYEVEFYNTSNYTEYDYEIDASSGDILSYDHEAEYYQRPSTGTGSSGNSGNIGTTTITEAQAQQIALSHAGLSSSQVSFIRSKLDWDDGRRVYEVEFYNTSNYTEYDYEIDASSGDILSYDHDAEYYQRPSTGTGSSGNSGGSAAISTEQAKQIALARVPGATDIRIHLDRDDGRLEYEGSIYYGSWEYEFTIDATTGAIREWERDSIYD